MFWACLNLTFSIFSFFLGTFSLFLENKHCNGMYNGNGNSKMEINRSIVWASCHWQDPQTALYHLTLVEKRHLDPQWPGWCRDLATNCQTCCVFLCPLSLSPTSELYLQFWSQKIWFFCQTNSLYFTELSWLCHRLLPLFAGDELFGLSSSPYYLILSEFLGQV